MRVGLLPKFSTGVEKDVEKLGWKPCLSSPEAEISGFESGESRGKP
jgi:hypothetical protein